jgi:acyl-CoA thioester hydrolase
MDKGAVLSHPGETALRKVDNSRTTAWEEKSNMEERSGAITYRGVVYAWYLDHMGHMNVQYYVHLFDQATWVLFDQAGLSTAYFLESGTGMAALEQHLSYKREVFAGTVVTIDSQVLAVTEKTVRFIHTMRDNEGVVASSEILGTHFDRTAHRSTPFPPAARARFQEM